MSEGSSGRLGGLILGAILILFGTWGVVAQEYSSEGYRWRNGLQLEGHKAVITGAVALVAGVHIVYLSLSNKKKKS